MIISPTILRLSLRLRRLKKRHQRLTRKLKSLDNTIEIYRRLRHNEAPTPLEEEAMHLARQEVLDRMVDVAEDVNIVESRILTVRSERARKRKHQAAWKRKGSSG